MVTSRLVDRCHGPVESEASLYSTAVYQLVAPITVSYTVAREIVNKCIVLSIARFFGRMPAHAAHPATGFEGFRDSSWPWGLGNSYKPPTGQRVRLQGTHVLKRMS